MCMLPSRPAPTTRLRSQLTVIRVRFCSMIEPWTVREMNRVSHRNTLCARAPHTVSTTRLPRLTPSAPPPPYRMQRPMHEYQLRKTIDAVLWD